MECKRVTIQVTPPIDIGRRGEPRVLACIKAYLDQNGTKSTIFPAPDQAGEDGVLKIDNDRVTVQIVTAGPSSSFWGRVAKGRGEVEAELAEATD